ncbi:hypothetical protein HD806DRAFT_518702 [Xylariaceae sp. AK1471]|nr:hypothetical protein HD806DRAFT_518702 [Xylariaceae sp. AK1471]
MPYVLDIQGAQYVAGANFWGLRKPDNPADASRLAFPRTWRLWLIELLFFLGYPGPNIKMGPGEPWSPESLAPPNAGSLRDVVRHDSATLVGFISALALIARVLYIVIAASSIFDFRYILALVFLGYSACTIILVYQAVRDRNRHTSLDARLHEKYLPLEECAICHEGDEARENLIGLRCFPDEDQNGVPLADYRPLHWFHEDCIKGHISTMDGVARGDIVLGADNAPNARAANADAVDDEVRRPVNPNVGRRFLRFHPGVESLGPRNDYDSPNLPWPWCPLCRQEPEGYQRVYGRPQGLFDESRFFWYIHLFFATRVPIAIARALPNQTFLRFPLVYDIRGMDRHWIQVLMRSLLMHAVLVTAILVGCRLLYLLWLVPLPWFTWLFVVGTFMTILYRLSFRIGYRLVFGVREGISDIVKGLRYPRRQQISRLEFIWRLTKHISWAVFKLLLWDVLAKALLDITFNVSLFVLPVALVVSVRDIALEIPRRVFSPIRDMVTSWAYWMS